MSRLTRMIALDTGLQENSVYRIMITAPVRYKEFYILKRNGGRRKISQPAREVKLVQRSFTKLVLGALPVHHCATAYQKDSSILKNAEPHAGYRQIAKMDLTNFFPSIKRSDWLRYCEDKKIDLSPDDIALSASLLYQKQKATGLMRLAIGAPSSPALSNILMFDFDSMVEEEVAKDKVTYTRYADDVTFSAPRTGHLVNVTKIVSRALRSINYPRLQINKSKTLKATTKYRRAVTGLILSNDGRVTLGRDRKRLVSARVHHAINSTMAPEELPSLAGYLAYVNSVEPEFLEKLRDKYGKGNISSLMRLNKENMQK